LITNTVKAKLKFWIQVIISGFLLFYILYTIDLHEFYTNITSISPNIFFISIVLMVFAIFMNSLKWKTILSGLLIQIPILRLFQYNMISIFYGNILPSQFSGDIIKGAKIWQFENNKNKEIIGSIVFDKLFSVFATVFLWGISSFMVQNVFPQSTQYLLYVLILLIIVFILTFKWHFRLFGYVFKKNKNRIEEMFSNLSNCQVEILIKVIVYSVLFQLLGSFIYYIIARSLNLNLTFIQLVYVFSITSIILMLPISFGGLGVKEGAFIYLLGQLAQTPVEQALTLSLSVTLIRYVVALGGGCVDIYVSFKQRNKRIKCLE